MLTYEHLPEDLPIPQDDGACDHLVGLRLPDLSLPATDGTSVRLDQLSGTTVLYCYPKTGQPGVALPEGWDTIPGARGCTPQSCAFRDHHAELAALGARVFGISTQDTPYQQEMAERLHLPFLILSDHKFGFCDALNLPTFEADGHRLMKRVTLIVKDGKITTIHYPVFPSDADAEWVIAQLSA